MKTYIIICCFADRVAGGPIYYANKVKYMKEQEWNVAVIPADTGERSAVRGLDEYFGPYVPYLGYMPSEFTARQRERILSQLLSFVPADQEEIVIETGTDYTAYWGELLAERIHAKHILIFLDEQNPFITKDVIGFYKFKYDRNELACISNSVMKKLFGGLMTLSLEECRSLPCDCTNSIEDYESPLNETVGGAKYNIGYIGRLEKPFVPEILKDFVAFCELHSYDSISISFFGGAYDSRTVDSIIDRLNPYPHVKLTITGYIFPLPIKALQKMDVFVSGAGSATVALKAGVYSVRIDQLTYQPVGLIENVMSQRLKKCPVGNSVLDYLNWILIDKTDLPQRPPVTYQDDWKRITTLHFPKHMEFLRHSESTTEYYDIVDMTTVKGRKKRLLRTVLGVEGYERFHHLGLKLLGRK